MKARLWVLLSLAFAVVALAAAFIFFVAVNRAVETQFISYISNSENSQLLERLAPTLRTYYQEHQTWQGVEAALPAQGAGSGGNGQGAGSGGNGQGGGSSGNGQGKGPSYLIIDPGGTVIYDSQEQQQGQAAPAGFAQSALPVELEGQTIAWLMMETQGRSNLTDIQSSFLRQVELSLLGISLLTILVAVVIGLLFSQALSRPLAALSNAAYRLSGGALGEMVETPSGTQEIESLRQSFNKMSQALHKSERQRQAMTSDIAHELRTPVSLIRTQLQAMMDGVRDISPENIALAYDQSIQLGQLIEELRTLTLAESQQLPVEKQAVDTHELLTSLAASFSILAQDAQLSLETSFPENLPQIQADGKRLKQIFGNLLVNALRYTEPGGMVLLGAQENQDTLQFTVANSGQTLSKADAQNVFDRFWWADKSRQRDTGGSGLGLAISQELVRLHDGRIWVEVSDDRTAFHFTLPK